MILRKGAVSARQGERVIIPLNMRAGGIIGTGLYTTTANAGSLDECPMAYKSPDRILGFLSETIRIDKLIRPIYNFKAC